MASDNHVQESILAKEVSCELCDYGEVASYHCDDCLMNLCDGCVENFHRKIGNRGHHSLSKGVAQYKMELELCPFDGEKMTVFCRDCNLRLCSECETSTKRHASHTTVGLRNYVLQEKEKLLERLDELSSKTAGLSYYSSEIHSTALNIELKWLEYKDAMNQEFASLMETILDRQHELAARMEQEVQKSLQDLRSLDANYADILSKTCELSDELISAVQRLSKTEFLQRHPNFKSSCDQMESQIHRLQSAADAIPTFLGVPFSLHQEKVHLNDCLRFGVFESVEVKAKDTCTALSPTGIYGIPTIRDLIVTPTALPPSTTMQYLTEIYKGVSRKEQLVDGHCLLAGSDPVLNARDCRCLQREAVYLVRVTPVLVCDTHRGREQQKRRPVTTMFLTDSSFQTNKPSAGRQQVSPLRQRQILKKGTLRKKGEKKQKTISSPQLEKQAAACNSSEEPSVLPLNERNKIYALPEDANSESRPIAFEGLLQMKTRFTAHCSFEEGRVLEDENLKFIIDQRPS